MWNPELFRQDLPLRVQLFQRLLEFGLLGGKLLEPGHLGADGRVGEQGIDFGVPVLQGGDFFFAFFLIVLFLADSRLLLLFGQPVLLRIGFHGFGGCAGTGCAC